MTFDDVLKDVEKMEGKTIECISSTAKPLTVVTVNWEARRVEVRSGAGGQQTRSFQELEKVWNALIEKIAVHVESDALHGGGSMRNQPETIFANLPYIEYLVIDGKKHLALVRGDTHELGTLRKMDPVQAREVIARFRKEALREAPPSVIIILEDLIKGTEVIHKLSGVAPNAVLGRPGICKFYHSGARALLVSRSKLKSGINLGVYPVIKGDPQGSRNLDFEIDGYKFFLNEKMGMSIIIAAD